MKVRLIVAALAVAVWLAPSAIAADPGASIAPDTQAVIEKLGSIERSLNTRDFVAATKAVDEIFGAPNFDEFAPQVRHLAFLFGALAALGRDELITAHEYAVAATSFPQAAGDDWALRFALAYDLQHWEEAGVALTTLANQWPDKLPQFGAQMIHTLTSAMGRDARLVEPRLQLIAALFTAQYTFEYGFQPAYLWRDLAVALIDKQRSELVTEVLQRIDDAGILARMRIDRRFDSLVKANPGAFDIAAAAKARCERIRKVMKAHPRDLQPVIEFMYAQYAVGAFKENIKLADQILKSARDAPKDEPPFDDASERLNWVQDIKAISLRALGRWDQSLDAQRQAWALRETSSDKVSQAINLGNFYNEHAQPEQALKSLEGIDWGRSLSGYGRMQLEHVRLRAYLQLDKRDEAETVLSYLRQNQKDALDTWQVALLDFGDTDGAAALLISRLRDPQQRSDALWSVQSFPSLPSLPMERQAAARWEAMLARDDVAAAIDEVGRRESIPIHDIGG